MSRPTDASPDLLDLATRLGISVVELLVRHLRSGQAIDDIKLVDAIGQDCMSRVAQVLADDAARKKFQEG
jgi:hypothetical protein